MSSIISPEPCKACPLLTMIAQFPWSSRQSTVHLLTHSSTISFASSSENPLRNEPLANVASQPLRSVGRGVYRGCRVTETGVKPWVLRRSSYMASEGKNQGSLVKRTCKSA